VLAQPVRLRPYPLGEAVVVQQVCFEVLDNVLRLWRTVIVDRQQVPITVVGVQVCV
jgi:hypothetical protein